MIEKNQQIVILKDHLSPLKSPNTHLVAVIRACDGKLADQGYHNTVGVANNGELRQTVVWAIDQKEISFKPFTPPEGKPEEIISPAELIKRYNSPAWLADNPDHPIAYCKATIEQLLFLRSEVRRIGTGEEIRKNGKTLFIPGDATPHEREKALAMLEKEISR